MSRHSLADEEEIAMRIEELERRVSTTHLNTRGATNAAARETELGSCVGASADETPLFRGRQLFSPPPPLQQRGQTFEDNVRPDRAPAPGLEASLIDSLVQALGQLMTQNTASTNLPRLPIYTGEQDSMEWNSFLETFMEILAINRWTALTSPEKATLLRSSLTKRAAETFNGLPADVKQNFERAKEELTRIFINPAKKVLFQNEFDNRIQGDKESLQDLVTSLRRLARRGYPEVASDGRALDSFVHRRFIEAIRDPTLRNQVRLFRRDTVEQTLVEAYRLEAALATERERAPKFVSAVVRSKNDDFRGGQAGHRDSGSRDYRRPDQLLCYNCNKPGHFARDCYSHSRYGTRGNNSNRDNAGNRNNQQLKD